MASSLPDLCGAVETSKDAFESRFNPVAMGNAANIAYGGCALAFGLNAAFRTVPDSHRLYSALGHYLGPALTDRKLRCTIRRTRSTRTFATRNVEVFQKQDNGEDRLVLFMVTDFHAREPASLLTYSAKPFVDYGTLEEAPPREDNHKRMVDEGRIPQAVADIMAQVFGPMIQFTDQRLPLKSIMGQNASGLLKKTKTTQDHLALPDKTSADWVKSKQHLDQPIDHLTALTFVMDGALSFLPLSHDHKFLDDASACSSLDFALRYFSNDISFNDWHLREMRTVTAAEGRTYTEGRLWDQKGNMIASMTQQSICRPKKSRSAKI